MLLIRGAEARSLPPRDGQALAAGSREAARWLCRCIAQPTRGPTRYPWEVYHKLMHRLAKAAAAHPNQSRVAGAV